MLEDIQKIVKTIVLKQWVNLISVATVNTNLKYHEMDLFYFSSQTVSGKEILK